MSEVVLRRFNEALEGSKDVDYHQIWRYTKGGRLPRVIKWLAMNPNLARALADDADEMAKQRTQPNDERPVQ